MLLPYAVPLAVAAVLAGAVATATPSPAPAVVPVLTSTPFGAGPGRPVSHTVTLSGHPAGTVAVRVTFRTTIGLDGLTVTTTRGRCQVTDPRSVVCDLRLPATDMAAAKIVVTGTLPPDTAAGALVQNWVSSHLDGATGPADATVSNAYLVAAGTPASRAASTTASRPAAGRTATGTDPVPVVVAVLIGLAAALAGLILLRRRRRHPATDRR